MPVMALGRMADCPKGQVKRRSTLGWRGPDRQTDEVPCTMYSTSYREGCITISNQKLIYAQPVLITLNDHK